MSEIKISSTGWLALYLPNNSLALLDLNDTCSWQYLQIESTSNENFNDFHRNLLRFSPNGDFLIVNGINNQLYLYERVDFEKCEHWWQLKRKISVENPISALYLSNKFLLVADKIGDIYKIDLSFGANNENDLIEMKTETPIIRQSCILCDMIYFCMNDQKLFILTAGQNSQINCYNYPNSSLNKYSCIGHTEFVSHIKLIGQNRLLSASGDGTFRLWHLPDCKPRFLLHSKALALTKKQIFYTELYDSKSLISFEDYKQNTMPEESSKDLSSAMDYSIWKMDVTSNEFLNSDVYIAFSLFGHRSHSIYLASLKTMTKLDNRHCELIFDSSYGTIIDYCFPPEENFFNDYEIDGKCFLYVLFSSNIFVKVEILSKLLCTQKSFIGKQDENIQEINHLLTRPEFHSMNYDTNIDTINFQKLFKNFIDSNNNYHLKRTCEIEEQQEQRKKQALS